MTIDTLPFRRHALLLALMTATCQAHAATINVNAACSLADAITAANTDLAKGGCPSGNGEDSINLAAHKTYTLTAENNFTDGSNGLPSVTSVITINGNGATVQRSDSTNTPEFRLVHVAAAGHLTLNSVTLKNGLMRYDNLYEHQGHYNGGGVFNLGIMTLTNSTVTSNSAIASGGYVVVGGKGGGIANAGTMSLVDSVVSGNTARGDFFIYVTNGEGGGIFNTGTLSLKNTTVSDNVAWGLKYGYDPFSYASGLGGGIWNSGKIVLTNSTVSDNQADFNGGGIFNTGTSLLMNSTLAKNVAVARFRVKDPDIVHGLGGGIWNSGALALKHVTLSDNQAEINGGGIFNASTLTLTNSLIANSPKGGDCYNNEAVLRLKGVNLIEDGSCGAPLSGDPKLGILLDNGGLTLTHALNRASLAVNAANLTLCLSTDQRTVKRPQPLGEQCDIGSFERIPVSPDSVSPSVRATVRFFTTQIASGGIVGVGAPPLADQRRLAVLNQLVAAGNYRDWALNPQACNQLDRLFKRIDPDNTPDRNDYVTGNEADTLAVKITALRGDWACP